MPNISKEYIQEIVNKIDLSSVKDHDNLRRAAFSNKEFLAELQKQYPGVWKTCKELVYWSLHYKDSNFIEEQFCLCGKRKNFDLNKLKYNQFCSPRCARIYSDEKIRKTNLEKYGTEYPSQAKEIKDKIKQGNLEKYGVEWTVQDKNIRNQIKKTNFEKYGSEHIGGSREIRNKIKQTCSEKYGGNAPICSKEIRNKIKQTNLEKYGCENVLNSKEIQNKIKQTNLERYGCENVAQSKEIQAKIKQTNLEKYGCKNPMQNEQIKEKTLNTLLQNYGVKNPMQSKEILDKIEQINLEKYGFKWALQNKEVRNKIRQTCLEKYGVENITNFLEIHYDPEVAKILNSKKAFKEFILRNQIRTVKKLAENLGISRTALRNYAHKYDLWHLIDFYTSSYELEIQELFPNTFVKTRKAIHPYEIDLYSEEHKFGIEFNGNYWHSEHQIESCNYHQKKSITAKEKGIFLYHIWEYEWLDNSKREIIISQIKNILGLNETKIYARKCSIKEVSFEVGKWFLEENHIQGSCSSRYNFGLYYGEELVSLMTFGKPRFNQNYEYELLRFCNKKGTSVVGGASKLFKHFLKKCNPKSILSYSHIDKGTGKLYENLGFKFKGISSPGYVWCKNEKVLSRYQCQKHKLLKQGLEGNSEKEIMESRGFIRIFDCGNLIWIYE